MRMSIAAGAGFAAALALGCGSAPPPDPQPLVGKYVITVAANGKTDPPSPMQVVLGSGNGLLLSFVYGVSPAVRCGLTGPGALSIPKQVLRLDHSSGLAEGTVQGRGTIGGDGKVDLTLDLLEGGRGVSAADGGVGTTYAITGARSD